MKLYDPARDAITITVTLDGKQITKGGTTAAAILQSDNERAKIFARSPHIPAMEYEDRGACWRFERNA